MSGDRDREGDATKPALSGTCAARAVTAVQLTVVNETDHQSNTRIVSENVRCMQCSYNVRGLPHRGSCPECGRAVVDLDPLGRQVSKIEIVGLAAIAVQAEQ